MLTVGPVTRPDNDDFKDRALITGTNLSFAASNESATREPDEPNHAGQSGGASVWWTWIAPTNQPGATRSDLRLVAANDDLVTSENSSQVNFRAQAGAGYRIAVDGFGGASGAIILDVQLEAPAAGDEGAAIQPTTSATVAGLPSPPGASEPSATAAGAPAAASDPASDSPVANCDTTSVFSAYGEVELDIRECSPNRFARGRAELLVPKGTKELYLTYNLDSFEFLPYFHPILCFPCPSPSEM